MGAAEMILRWLPIAAGALAGALLAGGVQQYRVMSAQRALSDVRSEYMQRVTDAQAQHVRAQAEARRIEQDARSRERDLQDTINQIDQEAHDAQQDYDRLIVSAGAERQRLLDSIAAAAAGAGHCDAGGADQPAPGKRPSSQLPRLLAEADALAQASAIAADDAIARGNRCVAAYEAARAAVNQEASH